MCRKSAGVNMHSSHSGETAPASPQQACLLRINMQAPGSSAAKGEAGQWSSSQTCRDHGSVRAGQVTCLEGHHKHIGMGVWYLFPLIFQNNRRKNGLELLEVGEPTLFVKETTQMSNPEALAQCIQPTWDCCHSSGTQDVPAGLRP